MKIVIIAFVVAIVVCMLIEFRHKFFVSQGRPGESSSRAGWFLGAVVVVLVLVVVVPFAVNFFSSDEPSGVEISRPVESQTMEEDQHSVKGREILKPGGSQVVDDDPGQAFQERVSEPDTSAEEAGVQQENTISARDKPGDATEAVEPPGNEQVMADDTDETPREVSPADADPALAGQKESGLQQPSPEAVVVDDARNLDAEDRRAGGVTEPPSKEEQEVVARELVPPVPDAGPAHTDQQVAVSDEPGGYPITILIGSYETREKAFEVGSYFSAKGDPAFTSYYTDPYEGSRYQVFMGNYTSIENAGAKARELKKRKFRQVNITNRMFAVQVGECSSYPVSEEIKDVLKKKGYIGYGVRCPDTTGYSRILLGAFLNDKLAREAALDILDKGVELPVTVVLR